MDHEKWHILKFCSSWTFEETLSLLVSEDDLSKIQMVSLVPERAYELCGGDYVKLAPIYQSLKRAVEDGSIKVVGNSWNSLRMTSFPQGYVDNWSPDDLVEALNLFGGAHQKPLPKIFWDRLDRESFLNWYQKYLPGIAEALDKIGRKILFEKQLGNLIGVVPSSKNEGSGGRPSVDPDGKIVAKIEELKLSGVEVDDIPWHRGFTRFVQKLRKDKITPKYSEDIGQKVHQRIKGPEYTGRVGISLDTAKNLMKSSPE
jgi:hypothetical protein